MKILPGSIVPINYALWPAKSNHLVMAMVLSCEDQWLNLCPVHCEPELAGFNDLVVMPEDSSLNMFMVVMGKLAAGFPIAAINPEVFAATEPPRIQSLNMPESECNQLRKQTFFAAADSSPETSFNVNRGNFIQPGSPSGKRISKLTQAWLEFNQSTWNHEFSSRKLIKEINVSAIIEELSRPLQNLIEKMAPLKLTPSERKISTKGYSSSRRELAGKLCFNPSFYFLKPENCVETLREELKSLLSETRLDNPTNRKLLQGELKELVQLLFQLFPR